MLFMRSTPDQSLVAHHRFQNTQACLQTFMQNYKDIVADNSSWQYEIPASKFMPGCYSGRFGNCLNFLKRTKRMNRLRILEEMVEETKEKEPKKHTKQHLPIRNEMRTIIFPAVSVGCHLSSFLWLSQVSCTYILQNLATVCLIRHWNRSICYFLPIDSLIRARSVNL